MMHMMRLTKKTLSKYRIDCTFIVSIIFLALNFAIPRIWWDTIYAIAVMIDVQQSRTGNSWCTWLCNRWFYVLGNTWFHVLCNRRSHVIGARQWRAKKKAPSSGMNRPWFTDVNVSRERGDNRRPTMYSKPAAFSFSLKVPSRFSPRESTAMMA